MKLKKVMLKNFRNIKEEEIKLSQSCNILYGDNAQGKTNILEAIYLCVSGRSFRAQKERELIKKDEKSYRIKVEYEKKDRIEEIEIEYSEETKKKLRINNVSQTKTGNIIGKLNAVIFSPEDILMIKQGPSKRRKYIDIAISQIRPSYFFYLQKYRKVLIQRNNLLRKKDLKEIDKDTIDIWNERLAEYGARIMKERDSYIKILSKKANTKQEIITDNKEKLIIKYKPSIEINKDKEIKEQIIDKLSKCFREDIKRGNTLYGPHRDDIEIEINSMDVKQYGSQGQQRTAVLSTKLAEVEIIKDTIQDHSIILLDDVMSELDDYRRKYLLEGIKENQIIITCTSKESIRKSEEENQKNFFIKQGKCYEQRTENNLQ